MGDNVLQPSFSDLFGLSSAKERETAPQPSAFHRAIIQGDLARIKTLLAEGIDINTPLQQRQQQNIMPLSEAVKYNH